MELSHSRSEHVSDEMFLQTDLLEWFKAMKRGPRIIILKTLESSPKGGYTFKEIVSILRLNPSSLAYHLKLLTDSGMLAKEFRFVEDRRDYSFYRLTENGRSFLLFLSGFKERRPSDGDEGFHEHPEYSSLIIVQFKDGPRGIVMEML